MTTCLGRLSLFSHYISTLSYSAASPLFKPIFFRPKDGVIIKVLLYHEIHRNNTDTNLYQVFITLVEIGADSDTLETNALNV